MFCSTVSRAQEPGRSYQRFIDANQQLSGILGGLEFAGVPEDIHKVLREQGASIAKGTRRLPSFVRTAKRVAAGESLFARVAEKMFGGLANSVGGEKLMIDVISSRISELVKPMPSAAAPPLPAKRGEIPARSLAGGEGIRAVIPTGLDSCSEFMLKLRAIEGEHYEPYSSLSLANLALAVSFNNYAVEISQLVPEELYPLALGINSAAAERGAKGIDPETMKSLELLMEQARRQDFSKFDQSVARLIKDAPEDFRKQAQMILEHAVYRDATR